MSYWNQSLVSKDEDLRARCVACAASEGIENPAWWVDVNKHQLAAAPGWSAAYASALANGRTTPGRAEDVITDGMVLSAVQQIAPPKK